MAEKRISELTPKGSNLQSTDLFEVSIDAGGGLYNTRYITGAQITSAVSSVNLYNANGTLTGNRTVTGGGFSLTFTGQSNYSIVSPSASALDTAFAVRNNTDTSNLIRVDGEGKIGINANPLAFSRFYVNANTGQYAGYFDASDEIALYASSVGNRGVRALSTNNYGVQGSSTNSVGGLFQSVNNYALWAQSTSAGTKLAILSNGGCDFKDYADTLTILKLKDNGNISIPNVQVGNVGVASGDLYFDTAANILANGDLICGRKV